MEMRHSFQYNSPYAGERCDVLRQSGSIIVAVSMAIRSSGSARRQMIGRCVEGECLFVHEWKLTAKRSRSLVGGRLSVASLPRRGFDLWVGEKGKGRGGHTRVGSRRGTRPR